MPEYLQSEEDYEMVMEENGVIIKYESSWCLPCLAIAPFLIELEKKYTSLKMYKVDVDDLAEIAAANEIESLPTFIMYKNGEEIERILGANKENLENLVSKFFN